MVARMGRPADLLPVGRVGLDPIAKPAIFAAGARQHRQKPSAVGGDVGQGFAGAQLTVGNIEKVGTADQFSERVPGVDMGLVVGGVAVGGAISIVAKVLAIL